MSFLRFLPVSFPVFPRQIARYPPCKNRKISSKETLKPDPGKIQTGFKVHKNNYFYIYMQELSKIFYCLIRFRF